MATSRPDRVGKLGAIWYMVYGIWVYGIWHMIYGYIVYGIVYMVYGVYGIWYMDMLYLRICRIWYMGHTVIHNAWLLGSNEMNQVACGLPV